MAKMRATISKLTRKYNGPTTENSSEEWEDVSVLTTESDKAMGGFLRALADEIDPPKYNS